MQHFREITETAARKIDRIMLGMAAVETLDELEDRFILESRMILPADCLGWDNWAPDGSRLMTFRLSDNYTSWLTGALDVFGEVVGHHPVIRAGLFEATRESVMRMSDFECYSRFRDNPLFREIYRHIDSHYQIAYTVGVLADRRIILTWNRRAFDFSERDRQTLEFMGQRLAVISRRIEERQRLEADWRRLSGFVDARGTAGLASSMGTRDVRLLARLLKSGTRGGIARDLGIRRDSVDKRLGSIRERLGLENHHQLLSALAGLRDTEAVVGNPDCS